MSAEPAGGCDAMLQMALAKMMSDPIETIVDSGLGIIVLALLLGIAWRLFKDISE